MAAHEKSAVGSDHRDSLYALGGRDGRPGTGGGVVPRSSLYTRAPLSDAARAIPLLALGGAVALGLSAVAGGSARLNPRSYWAAAGVSPPPSS